MSARPTPRMRMFAGPNGSGKSTLKEVISDAWLGIYINPDEMEKAIRQHGYLNFEAFHLSPVIADLQMFLANSELLANQGNALGHLGVFADARSRLVEARELFAANGDPDSAASVDQTLIELTDAESAGVST